MADQKTSADAPKGARRILRVLGRILLALVLLLLLAAGFVFFQSERRMSARFVVPDEPLTIPTDAESIARGERIARVRGCLDCHGSDGAGKLFLDAMPVMRLETANITPGGVTARWTGTDWTRALRHGVRPDGTGMLFMPVVDFRYMDDADLGALVAYLRTLPPVSEARPRPTLGPVGRVLFLKGELDFVPAENVDHTLRVPPAPPVGPTPEYGEYLSHGCIGCHGPGFSGGRIPGTPPDWPPAANITPDRATGIGTMTMAQFTATLREGRRRDGTTINPMHMPWRLLKSLTDDEIAALFAYLHTVPSKPVGNR